MNEDFLIKDKKFLDTLRDRLNRGNKRSIHLNALPANSATRLDLLDLGLISKDSHKKFINLLLSKDNFKIDITLPDNFELNEIDEKEQKALSVAIKRLKNITKQNNDYFLEHGIKPFGFGFPIIYNRDKLDPTSIIKAPSLIWNLEIEQDLRKINKWTIKRGEDFPIYINDVLISHIEKDENIKLEKLNNEYLSDSIIDNNELVEIVTKIFYQFGSKIEQSTIENLLQNISKSDCLKAKEELITAMPSLAPAGVFGLYLNQKQSIIEDYKLFIEDSTTINEDDLIFEKIKINPFSSVETDPSQQGILSKLSQNKRIIIQGPPGTGKSQTLTAIITNALANELKCLIVCEKITALEVIYNNLKRAGLERLCALIEDTAKDRRKIIDSARETVDDVNKTIYKYRNYNFDKNNYTGKINKAKDLSKKINEFHSFLNTPIFSNSNWTDIVGLRMKYKDSSKIESINRLVDRNTLLLTNDEFIKLLAILKKAKVLTGNIKNFEALLSNLNYGNLKSKGIIEIKSDIIQCLSDIDNQGKVINEKLKIEIDLYTDKIKVDFDDYFCNYKNIINQNNILFQNNIKSKFFKEYSKNSNKIFLSLFSVLSNKYKKIKNESKQYIKNIDSIIECNHYLRKIISHSFKFSNTSNIVQLHYTLKLFSDELETLYSTKDNLIKNHIDKLSFDSLFEIKPAFDIKETFDQYQNLIKLLNENQYFNSNKSIIKEISNISIDLNNLINTNKDIKNELDYLSDYLEWNKFYSDLNNQEKIIINVFSEYNYDIDIFSTWYLDWILNKHSNSLTHIKDKIPELQSIISEIEKESKLKILDYWQTRRINSIYRFNSKNSIDAKQLFIKTNHGGKRKSLRQIIQSDIELFSDIFPVILVNPAVCSSLFPPKPNLFDVVIFDEASQLRIEDTFTSLIRGKIKIISGDEHQMPPSSFFVSNEISLDSSEDDEIVDNDLLNERNQKDLILNLAYSESLLEYATNMKYESMDLQIHYRSRHPLLINFSNAAFYNSKLKPVPPKKEYKPIRYINVDGLYINQTNETEAKQVISILKNDLIRNENNNYPSVGIATFNIHQRNLIIDEINKECALSDEFRIKIENLYKEGLFIKNLENIQGDERDYIIISTTFGRNKDNVFNERFGPLNTAKGQKLLNVIITRAKYKVFVISSFPENKLQSYNDLIVNNGKTGKAILYAYLSYAKAIEENNSETIEHIINLLSKNNISSDESNLIGTESPFEQEVLDYLLKNGINSNQIELQYWCGGFRIDIIIKSKFTNKPIIAIECDGAYFHNSTEAYMWDMFRQKQLEQHGFKFFRIWSYDWWLNPQKQILKLIDFIATNDNNASDVLTNDIGINYIDEKLVRVTQNSFTNLIPRKTDKAADSNPTGNKNNEEHQEIDLKVVKSSSIVTLLDIGNNITFKVTFEESSFDKGIKLRSYKSPLAQAVIGKRENDSFTEYDSNVMYKIIKVE